MLDHIAAVRTETPAHPPIRPNAMKHIAMKSVALPILFVFAAVALGGCATDPVSPSFNEVIVIGPQRMTCQGFIEQQCLMQRNEETGAWEFFYEEIGGFTHVSGFIYTLEVELRDRGAEIQDVGRYSYHLVEIKSKEAVRDDFSYKF